MDGSLLLTSGMKSINSTIKQYQDEQRKFQREINSQNKDISFYRSSVMQIKDQLRHAKMQILTQ